MPSLTDVEILWNNKKEETSDTTLKKERTVLGFNKPDTDITSKKTSSPGVLFDGSRMLAFRIFDKDDDGLISVEELRKIMKNMGDKMTDQELDEMLDAADTKHDGMVNYTGL